MYKYFVRIFIKKNNPKFFNYSLIFPFLATILSTIIPIITYCIINTMESDIAKKVISINNKSTIYLEDVPSKEFKNTYHKISDYLKSRDKKTILAIKQNAILSYHDDFNSIYNRPVTVFGVENRNELANIFNLQIDSIDLNSGTIIIGDKLASYLNFPRNFSNITIISPLDANFLVPYKNFNYIDKNFSFNQVNAIDDFSSKYVFINYDEAISLFENTVPYIGIDNLLTKKEIKYIKYEFGDIKYSEWMDIYPLFFDAINTEKVLYTSFGFIIVIIAGFNLYGIINLIFYRKRHQLTALMYMGLTLKDIKKMFLLNVISIGSLGVVLGIIISIFTLHYNLIGYFIPILDNIEIFYQIIPMTIFFNMILLLISVYLSITKNTLKIGNLSSNVLRS